ncbi:ABC transporter substrate-binding protein [Clostridium sp. YIM B02515]|uniref:ABC transporter substrate-binding protein n=1 Tax=Clostridium rhizosphaerae TaxID=2803861 RepID=A0ABS1T8F5_9CLOT|nr:ABC transporter substrate-binding protein [Clostridium rhizosphaerae]MBL4934283.1 ABC transporter substrate-binding protein [Clostridium rhizosphaerae]
MKRLLSFILSLIIVFSLIGCSSKTSKTAENVDLSNWDAVLKASKGTTVTFYGWGGNELTNKWVDNYLAKAVKNNYDITLKRVPMNIDDILHKLLAEKQAGSKNGSIDIVWINGENFYNAKKANLLYGPFSESLPNFKEKVDTASPEVTYDFGFPVEGYEVPFGKAQFVMLYNSDKVSKTFNNTKELMDFVKSNQGKFTYPAPPDFTGSAFVRTIICNLVDPNKLSDIKADKAEVQKVIQPALDYLNELKPYLWNKGKSYPATIAQLDSMYSDGQLLASMTYNPYGTTSRIENGELPSGTKSLLLDKGTVGNTHFLAIAGNSQNKAGAMAVINQILSAEAQALKYDPKNWGDLPVISYDKLQTDEKKLFDNIKLGQDSIPQNIMLQQRIPELRAELVPIIEKLWLENVAKGD